MPREELKEPWQAYYDPIYADGVCHDRWDVHNTATGERIVLCLTNEKFAHTFANKLNELKYEDKS